MARSEKKPFLNQCFVAASIFIASIGHGCGVGFIAILAPQVSSPGGAVTLTADHVSWIASISGPTLLAGNFLTVPLMSKYGRRTILHIINSSAIVGWLIMITAKSFEALFVGRTLQGISLGIMLSLRSVLLGEYTSPTYRGAFLTCIALGQTFGILIVHLSGSLLSWQMTGLLITLILFVALVMTVYTPESPTFLAFKGRYDECRKAFRWLRADEEEPELQTLIETCKHFTEKKSDLESHPKRFLDNFKIIQKPELYKPIIVMTHVYFSGQFSCSNVLANYPIQIIGGLLGPGTNISFWMVFLDAQRLICNFLTVFFNNKVKRRTMVFSTSSLCIFSQVAIAAYTSSKSNNMLLYDGDWIPILLINLQVMSIGLGMVPMSSVIAGEVFPLQYKGIGSSISLAGLSVAMFISLKTYPYMIETLGLEGTYLCYAIFLIYSTTVIWFLLPETKGHTLQEIENVFRGGPLRTSENERESLQEVFTSKIDLLFRKDSIQLELS